MNPVKSISLPRVSIIIPIYNVDGYLHRCLESISQQSIMPNEYEVLIVDDASTDNSLKIAQDFQRSHNNIVVIENKQNIGQGRSRNIAINHAKGDYLYFLDGDDYLDPVAIEAMLMYAIDNKSDLVIAGFIRVSESGEDLYKSNFPASIAQSKVQLMKKVLAYDVSSMIGNRLIKKSLFLDNNIEFPSGLHEDVSVLYKLILFANNVVIYPDYLYYWVERRNSTVDTISRIHIDGMLNGIKSRMPFLLEFAGKGFIRKIYPDLQKGVFKATHQMYRRIMSSSNIGESERPELLIYLVNEISKVNEGYESILTFSDYDKEFVNLLSSINFMMSINLPTEVMYDYITKKIKDYESKNIDLDQLNATGQDLPLSFSVRLENFIKSIRHHPGSFIAKIRYVIKRVLQYINKHLIINKKIEKKPVPKYKYEVLFVCDVDYHIRNAAPIVKNLRNLGISSGLIDRTESVSEGKRKLSKEERDKFRGLDFIKFTPSVYDQIDLDKLQAIIYFNDWGDNNYYVRYFRRKGIKTIGINEGVNDFLKLGEGFTSKFSPYRTCEYAIFPGEFDTQFFLDRPGQYFIGGLPRIRQLYREPVNFPSTPIAVINVNFTYGVLTHCRDQFLKTAIEGCKKADIDYVITQHPMDNSDLSNYNVSEKNMYDTIREGTIFISRFSGAIIEALALGKPCVYHNPHNEEILKFQDPLGAYSISHDSDSLASSIKKELSKIEETPVREYSKKFLDFHANISDPLQPDKRITQIIVKLISEKSNS